MKRQTAILILGDQLSWHHPALISADPDEVVIVMAEVMEEATYVRHNRHKIALLFSAMRHFAQALRAKALGWHTTSTHHFQPCWRPVSKRFVSGNARCFKSVAR